MQEVKRMSQKYKTQTKTYRLVFSALMAAMVYIGTLIRIPLGSSKVQVANAVCVFAGFILNPVDAGVAAGLGSALYDVTLGGYDALGCVITFISKFLMAFAAGRLLRFLIRRKGGELRGEHTPAIYLISALSALVYVALYMLKTFLMGLTVDGLALQGVYAKMLTKLPASLINAAGATVIAPLLYWSVRPPLMKAGIIAKLNR